jgi:polar amino acid transport system substrate-binding protein
MINRVFKSGLCCIVGLVLLTAPLITASSLSAQPKGSASVAPKGELRVALMTFNPVLVTRNPEGQFGGVSVELANAFGEKLKVPVRLVPYENTVRYNQSLGKDEWDVGFAPRDLSRTSQVVFSEPFMEFDSSYVTRAGSTLRTPEEVDRPGVKVAVAQGSAIDGYLTRSLKSAEIVRLVGGLVAAQETLSSGRADVYADFSHVAYRVASAVPGTTVMVSRFNVVRTSIVVPKSNEAALPILNDFIQQAKKDGLIADAIKRAGLRSVRASR